MFTQTNVPIPGLLDGYESALTEMGYSMTTKLLFIRRADLIIRQHMNKGLEYLDRDTICAYTREIDGKYFNGGMQRRHYERTRREIDRFVAYAFGHTNDESVKPYIATDIEHLKMCSLPFDGIAPKGGGTV